MSDEKQACEGCGEIHNEELTAVEKLALEANITVLAQVSNEYVLELYRSVITELFMRLDPEDTHQELFDRLHEQANQVFDPETTPWPDLLENLLKIREKDYRGGQPAKEMTMDLDEIIHAQGVLDDDEEYGNYL